MEIDEVAARLIRQYWALLAACVVVPLLAITLIVVRQPPLYAANARIVTGTVIPASSAQANAIVSQVQGIATSRTAVSKALLAAGAQRNLAKFLASNVSVTGLGSSQVVDLTVTDTNARIAKNVDRVLAAEVVASINNVGQSGLSAALKAVDQEIVRLTETRAGLTLQVAANPRNQQLKSKLAGLDEVIANFSGDRGRLLIQASTQGLATVIDKPALPDRPQSKALAQKLGLAAVLGLVLAILIASIAEAIRPTVPGARRVGRRLNVPTLGHLSNQELAGERTPGMENMGLRLRLAAAHTGVSTVALVDIDGRRQLADLAHGLESILPESAPSANGVRSASLGGNHFNTDGASAAADATMSILTKSRDLVTDSQALHIYPIAHMRHLAGTNRVGILVISGPVARVSRITALDDLVRSSGWPMIGVVAVPRRQSRRDPDRQQASHATPPGWVTSPVSDPAEGADEVHRVEGDLE